MRLANIDGRAALLVTDDTAVDVHDASDGKFGPTLRAVYDDWAAFRTWAEGADLSTGTPFTEAALGAPSPEPRQVFAIGLNYSDHAAESGFDAPTDLPPVFPKFLSSLSGPYTDVVLPKDGKTDWEVELVVVIGSEAHGVSESAAWDHVAGVTVGNDISERVVQLRGPAPQFGLGKSFPGFSPTGPWLVTTDDVPDRDDLQLTASLDDEVVQDGRTSQLIFPIARLIAELSKVVTLYPGDLIFSGTPAGVGVGRNPKRFIAAGQTLVSSIEGIGELRQNFVGAEARS